MSRLALRNFLITALTTIISIAVFISLLLGQLYIYSSNEQFKSLEYDCLSVSYMALTWLTESYRLDTTALGDVLTAQSELKNTQTMIVDTDGNVLLSVNPGGVEKNCGVLPEEITRKLADGQQLKDIGTLGGWFENKLLSFGMPVYDSAGNIRAAVIISALPDNIPMLFSSFAKTVIYITVFVLMLSFTMVYFISQRLTEPLKSMATAAKKMARGDYSARVKVRGNNEIADLAVAFNHMAESMEELEKIRSEFVANVSHELKTPMTSIAGFVDGILDGTIPKDRQDHYLSIVSEEVHRLSRLVTKLLLATRMQSGAKDLNLGPVDICSIISSVLVGAEQAIEDRELEVQVDYAEDRVFVLGDRDGLTQVVSNLIDNAIKYNRDGGHLAVTVERFEEKVFVTVFNTGEGIRQEDIPYVFDRFYKADRSRGLDKKSTGLGLYLVKSILKNLHQQIAAESSYGNWVRFTFTLEPTAPPEAAEQKRLGGYQ
ncbi:MAG: HAMP domain-containing histidine kinase [Clostridia bacterium]|nr:HAMP domain-containing histidine kinase [Clostridia bacterium]